ncbi:MAG: hypothetical protein M3P16_03755 [Chloroflexota bacterium]|nr:hypothetical protein [Chloroflexota bacterium]
MALVATLAVIAFASGRLPLTAGAPAASDDAHAHSVATTVAAPQSIVPPTDGSRVTLSTAPAAKPELGYTLSVKVISPAGMPVNDATIRFYDIVDLFGQREELVGSAVTDGQGLTAISYLPAATGAHQIVARFAGQGTLTPSLGVTTFEATVAAPTYTVDRPALATFSAYVPYAAAVVVLVVWGLIALSLFGTARGVVARANESRRKGGTA